ncbi:T9SS C-terminal target domain-containing protein [Chryseobacterium shandongense]|uniref:T9SS C-terminal target domain-containing protein n=2 Tax=Chryseobacterium TaxID=59732 RepID=A0AAD0YGK2_9FLAO|nr:MULTISPECIES: T9SS type A sorting domain-containing protein [Chryseobacterium]AZA88559.1 T9SS C-terminal target domain-containing protein [Chryseobacterium shandongense]AZA97101.1 T9SS C-terminal target domain-containing protein [Chryseobacterium shandongense]OCK52051.1 hypothetical protein BA768_14070 [Chryseobacterium sp. CBo1]SUX48219.1 delta-60 repeat domain [Chryseobacterium indoltheticum]
MSQIKWFTFMLLLSHCFIFGQPGSLDTSFNVGSGVETPVETICIQPDGKILVGGSFLTYNGVSKKRIVRLLPDGSIDNTFNTGTSFSGIVYKIKLLPNGKIFVAGAFSSFNGVNNQKFIVRLNSDGTLDTSFNANQINNNMSSFVYDFAVLPDNKVIIVGNMTNFQNTGIKYLAKLNADGSLDTSFNQGTGFNYPIRTVGIQSDGKIIVGGDFTTFNGYAANYLTRLNTDGSKDTTFNPGGFGSSGIVTGLTVLADDKILAGGSISSYNYQSGTNEFIRLNANGTLDQNFAVDYDAYVAGATEIVLQPDNKILVVGTLTYFNNQPARSLIRLNYDGSNDSSFNIQGGPNTNLITCALQSDGKIVIGGNFTNYNGVSINRIARIIGGGSLSVAEQTKDDLKIYPNPTSRILQISPKNEFQTYTIYSYDGRVIEKKALNSSEISVEHLVRGNYFILLSGKNSSKSFSFIKE